MTEAFNNTRAHNVLDACDLIGEARDYAQVVVLACASQRGAEAGSIMRIASLLMDTLDRAEILLEQRQSPPNVIRKEMT